MEVPDNPKSAIVCDIDDTFVRANAEMIGVWKRSKDGTEKRLTSAEYAVDPDAGKPENNWMWDFRELNDKDNVYHSLLTGTPLSNNLRFLGKHLRAHYDFIFLTAHSLEYTIYRALKGFIFYRNNEGQRVHPEDEFNLELCAAINNAGNVYEGINDSEKKANILKKNLLLLQ